MKKISLIIISITIALFFALVLGNRYLTKPKNSDISAVSSNISVPVEVEKNQKTVESPADKNTKKDEPQKLPEKILLEVPFLSQAPFQKWDALHEDACEEASLIMVKYFLENKKIISKEQGEKEIQNLISFENKNKYGPSITLEELNIIAGKFYELKSGRVEKNMTIDDIKKELALGKPVIAGAAGKVLPNPNFKNGGPNYHMLVIVGYDQNGFITNDPGTRLGENFRYTFNDLYNSIHDWNPKNILNGGKDYLVFD